jgi:TonB family protein
MWVMRALQLLGSLLVIGCAAPQQPSGAADPIAVKPFLELAKSRPALELYEPVVTGDNFTPLGVAREPFAKYLVAIHNRIHPVFAEKQLDVLSRLPKDDRLNDMTLSTDLEIVLAKDTGKIVRLGVTKSSGVAAYDSAVLATVQRAAPFGEAPDIIASPDGNVYVHWEFHRDPMDACTTRNARPYLLARAPAPPRTEQDQSRRVGLRGGQAWNCAFPPEADVDKIDVAVVSLRVIVQPDGTTRDVEIVRDPGHGFGRAARACALAMRYTPARDLDGAPILGTGIVNVRFAR